MPRAFRSYRFAMTVVAGLLAVAMSSYAVAKSAASVVAQQASPKHMKRAVARPKILGISHVAFYAASPSRSDRFYEDLLGLVPDASRPHVFHVGAQSIELEPLPPNEGDNRLSHVAFATDDAERMRAFLATHGVAVPEAAHHEPNGTVWFALKDPEGHPIEFVEEHAAGAAQEKSAPTARKPQPVSHRIIHAGVVVRDR